MGQLVEFPLQDGGTVLVAVDAERGTGPDTPGMGGPVGNQQGQADV